MVHGCGLRAGILGLGACVPDKIMHNRDLEKMVDTTDEWIRARTGIAERRIAAEDETTFDLSLKASKQALAAANIDPKDLDLIIVATVTPDMLFPATACLLQEHLGAPTAAAFDMEIGCSGFVYGLIVAAQFVATGACRHVLVVGAETLSKITDWEDRNTCVLFGDGAGAAVVGPVPSGGILGFDMGSDGAGGVYLNMPGGGSLNPPSHKTVDEKLHYIRMDGNQVFKFAVRIMGQSAEKALMKAGKRSEDVDLYIPHQANIRIIDASARRLGLPKEKVYVNLEYYGNTSSASIPIALKEALSKGLIKGGDLVVLVAFGAGLSWASTVIEFPEEVANSC